MPAPVPDYTAELDGRIGGLRLGVPDEYFTEGIDPEIERVVRQAIDVFRGLGATTDAGVPAHHRAMRWRRTIWSHPPRRRRTSPATTA